MAKRSYGICPRCKMKSVAPEKGADGWNIPPNKICNNCLVKEFGAFKIIAKKKRLIKPARALMKENNTHFIH